MAKNLKTIIEEQRELAEDLHEWHRDAPTMKAQQGRPAMNLPTYLILRYFDDVDQEDRLEKLNAQTLSELATAMRGIVERDVVESVWLSKGDLVWSIVFSALHEVDWEELAAEYGNRLRERADVLEAARASGLLTLIQAADDLPKN